MNKRGNAYLGFTIGLVIYIFGVLFIPFITDDITQARVDLQCSSPTEITGGTMILCLMVDTVTPYLIWGFCSVFIGMIVGRNT